MRKSTVLLLSVICVLSMATAAGAATVIFTGDSTLGDLNHDRYYTWGIHTDWRVPQGEQIASATLYIDNINDWQEEATDFLYIHLLDDPGVGVASHYDAQGNGDAFASWPLIDIYSDNTPPYGENQAGEYKVYPFDSVLLGHLENYIADGEFGFGFDPDCYFYNDGVRFEITTSAVPVPPAVLLLGSGLIGIVGLKRKAVIS